MYYENKKKGAEYELVQSSHSRKNCKQDGAVRDQFSQNNDQDRIWSQIIEIFLKEGKKTSKDPNFLSPAPPIQAHYL